MTFKHGITLPIEYVGLIFTTYLRAIRSIPLNLPAHTHQIFSDFAVRTTHIDHYYLDYYIHWRALTELYQTPTKRGGLCTIVCISARMRMEWGGGGLLAKIGLPIQRHNSNMVANRHTVTLPHAYGSDRPAAEAAGIDLLLLSFAASF